MTPLLLLLLLAATAFARALWPDAAFCTQLRARTVDMFADDVAWSPDASPIEPGLWLGNVCAATDSAFLTQYNITRIVNMAVEWNSLCEAKEARWQRRCFALDDVTDSDAEATGRLLVEAAAAVAELRAQGHTVLVHCNMGVSRSSAVVLRHLMDREPTLMYSEALGRLRRLRSVARPNALFEALLDTLAERKRRWRAKFEL
jgi:predicted protein tyrosine phosphatase